MPEKRKPSAKAGPQQYDNPQATAMSRRLRRPLTVEELIPFAEASLERELREWRQRNPTEHWPLPPTTI
jgi:hypothetical protein